MGTALGFSFCPRKVFLVSGIEVSTESLILLCKEERRREKEREGERGREREK